MIPRFFDCSIPQCLRPSVRGTGGCDECGRYLCVVHLAPTSHTCQKLEALDDATWISRITTEIGRLQSRINDEAACRFASGLNGGRECTIEHFSEVGPGALMGAANYHARIRFRDGSPNWLMRVPRVASHSVGLQEKLANYLITSEFATLRFLEGTSVPSPRVFGYGVHGDGFDHGVGVSFLLMEEMPGKPWHGEGPSGEDATDEERAKVWSGLADILAELSRHPFSRAGSLYLGSADVQLQVSATASDRFVVLTPEGPFNDATSYYTAFAEQHLSLIADGQLYTEYPVEAYLVYRFLKDNAQPLAQLEGGSESFFLKHVDDKGDHILVDEMLNITGIIDWQMARVVPRHEAFGASLVTADMRALCDGAVGLTKDDVALADALRGKGMVELAACMEHEKVRRFFWGLACETKWKYALPLASGILEVFGVSLGWEEWRVKALEDYGADERLKCLLESGMQ